MLTCPLGYKANNSLKCEPADMTPPTPSLLITAEDNLIVQFDKPMIFSAITSEVISVDISIPNAQVNSASWNNPTFNGSESMMVGLSFQSSYLPEGSEVILTFLNKELFRNEDNVTISISSLKGNLNAFGAAPSNSTSLLNTPAAQQAKAGVVGGVSASATVSIVNMNPQCLISMVNQLQLMSYIALTNVSMPQDFASTLAALNMRSLISSPFTGKIDTNYTSQIPPHYMQQYGISSTLFLPNAISFLGISTAVLLSYIPIYLLSKVNNEGISRYFGAMMPSLIWGVPLQLWMTSYLDVGIYSYLQLMYVSGASSDLYIFGNVLLALLFSALFIATPLLIATFTYRNYDSMITRDNGSFNMYWGVLYMRFRASGKYTSVVYYSYFTIRRFLFAVTLIFLQNSLSIILLVNLSTAITVSVTQSLMYVLVYRPFEGALDHITAVVNEASTSLVYMLVCVFLYDIDPGVGAIVGKVGLWVVQISVYLNSGLALCQTFSMVIQVIKEYQRNQQRITISAWARPFAVPALVSPAQP